MGTGCGVPNRHPLRSPLSRDATQLHLSPYNDPCKKLASKGGAALPSGHKRTLHS